MKLIEEDLGHLWIVVLSSMDKEFLVAFSELTGQRCTFDELGAGTNN
jgi:hypothetical protein